MSEGYKRHDEVIKTTLTELVLLLHFGFVMAGGALVIKYKEALKGIKPPSDIAKPPESGGAPGSSSGDQGDKGSESPRNGVDDGVEAMVARGYKDCLVDKENKPIPLFTVRDARDGRVFLSDYIKLSANSGSAIEGILADRPEDLREDQFLKVAKSIADTKPRCRYAYIIPKELIDRNEHMMALFGHKADRYMYKLFPPTPK